MKLEQILKPKNENIKNQFGYSGHTEQCGHFVGHPSDPCERCGFSYYSHTG
nr:hypothetical protein [uncultured Psychroserpens sp.]